MTAIRSRNLVIGYFSLAVGALSFVPTEKAMRTEAGAFLSFWPEGVSFVLVVSVVALPLLVTAVILDHRARKQMKGAWWKTESSS